MESIGNLRDRPPFKGDDPGIPAVGSAATDLSVRLCE
jgi:hypothetical protein